MAEYPVNSEIVTSLIWDIRFVRENRICFRNVHGTERNPMITGKKYLFYSGALLRLFLKGKPIMERKTCER